MDIVCFVKVSFFFFSINAKSWGNGFLNTVVDYFGKNS